MAFNQDWSTTCVLGPHGSCSLHLLTRHAVRPITLEPPSLRAGNRERVYIDTNRDRKEDWLPEHTSLNLHSTGSSPSRKRRSGPARLPQEAWPQGGCTSAGQVGVMSGQSQEGGSLPWKRVNSGSSGLRTPSHPPPSLWNPLIKLGAEISALKCRLCAGIQAAAPERGGHFLGPVSLNGLFVPAGPLSIRCD